MRETARAKTAWADYLSLGPDRSLEALKNRYQAVRTNGGSVPTVRLPTLADWSRTFGWQQRLKDLADREAKEAEECQAEYRRQIMEEGFAKDYERIRALKGLAVILEGEILQDDRRWLRDVKQIGSGEFAERVDIERFNAAEVEQFRGLLDDIAKEKGERKPQAGLTLDGRLDLTHDLDDDAARRLADLIARGLTATAEASS